MTSFADAVAYAKTIEKKALEPMAYDGPVATELLLDLYPDDIDAMHYRDLVNQYEKIQKVIKASSLDIFTTGEAARVPAPEVRREEIEANVKKLTTSAVEELEKELEALEMPARPPSPPAEPELVFEKPSEPLPEPIATEKPEEKPPEAAEPPAKTEPAPKKAPPPARAPSPPISAPTPPARAPAPPAPPPLERAPEAEKRYQEIEDSLAREWGGRANETSVKKKMLELTKELFKEKSVNRREQIKTEIAVLKNMLDQLGKKKTSPTQKDYDDSLWRTLEESQRGELADAKDALAAGISGRIEAIKREFYASLGAVPEDDREQRKSLYEKFVFNLTHALELAEGEIAQRRQFLADKHVRELEPLRDKVSSKKTRTTLETRAAGLPEQYTRAFAVLEITLKKSVENLMDKMGHEILTEPEGAPAKPEKEEQLQRIVFEVNETDDGTLLYYLHSKNPDIYKRYERKHLSKSEALLYAKVLLAKEKGLSDQAIRKYLGSLEGDLS